jgi:transposase
LWLPRSLIIVSAFIGPGWLPEQLGSLHKAGSTKMTQISTATAGIDTAKDKLDIAIHGGTERWQVANTAHGFRRLSSELVKAGVERVGIEATGGYERGVVKHLRAAGFTVLVLQPMQVKAYGRVHLRRAKNDALDAALVAACAAAIDGPRFEPDVRLEDLADGLTFVEQIEEDIARFKTRLEHIHDARLKRIVVRDIARLKARRAAEMLRIVSVLRSHSDLAQRFDLVQSVPGIGERTALALIIRMPELGRISREEAAALAGLAPFDDDSGKHKGQRHIAGGRGRLRRSLYAAALPASFRWNKALIDFYRRLTERGIAHNAALIACARKLLIYSNTVVHRGTPWVDRPAAV